MWAAESARQRGAMRAVSKVSPMVDAKAVQWAVLESCWVEQLAEKRVARSECG